jgi:hypothetical protein
MMHLQMMERGRAFIIALYLLRQQQGVKKARASQLGRRPWNAYLADPEILKIPGENS